MRRKSAVGKVSPIQISYKFSILWIVIHVCSISLSQNLVINGSFENTFSCDNHFIDSTLFYWYTPKGHWGTADLFQPCQIPQSFGDFFKVPENIAGIQESYDGEKYAGLVIHAKSLDDSLNLGYREYLTGTFDNSLEKNTCYKVSFMYSLGEYASKYAISNFGIYFSDSIPLSKTNTYDWEALNYEPQIDVNQFLNNRVDWVKIERFYFAEGGEKYFTLGNFNNNEATDKLFIKEITDPFNANKELSYLYIDDVRVEKVYSQSSNEFNLGYDTVLCKKGEIDLEANLPNGTIYVWNQLHNDSIIHADSSGTYTLEAYYGCAYTSINVEVAEVRVDLGPNICNDGQNQVILKNNIHNSFSSPPIYKWSTGEDSSQILVNDEGIYALEINNLGCIDNDTINVRFKNSNHGLNDYNVFSPNGDGINDVFTIYESENKQYQIQIFNRWGNLVWQSENPEEHWSAIGMADGKYYYYLTFMNCAGDIIKKKGSVQVLR